MILFTFLFASAILLSFSFGIDICYSKNFTSVPTIELESGGRGVVSVYQYKPNGKLYLKKKIPKNKQLGVTEKPSWQAFRTEATILHHLQGSGMVPELFCVSDPLDISYENYKKRAGHVYMMMEFIPGKTLTEFVLEVEDPEVLRKVLKRWVMAIQTMHEHGVVHFDIKPDNVMIDGEGKVKIIDFGGSVAPSLGIPVGDFLHMTDHFSPKVVRDVSAKLDWYGLGASAYFSRLMQLWKTSDHFKFVPITLSNVPEGEGELKQLIDICTNPKHDGKWREGTSFLLDLPYFKNVTV